MSAVDTVRTATNRLAAAVIFEKLDYAGTSNFFETDQAITDTATLTIDVTCNIPNVTPTRFWVDELRWMINPTAAETYQLYLLEGPTADDSTQASDIIYASPAALVDSTEYVARHGLMGSLPTLATTDGQLPVIVDLTDHTPGKIYYLFAWTGAPGDTLGYIKGKGRLLK